MPSVAEVPALARTTTGDLRGTLEGAAPAPLAGKLRLHNGSRLVASGNVVVVDLTHQVAVFGGFELGDLRDGFADNVCPRDDISAFGGGADRVTVFGESVGATSVLALMASPANSWVCSASARTMRTGASSFPSANYAVSQGKTAGESRVHPDAGARVDLRVRFGAATPSLVTPFADIMT